MPNIDDVLRLIKLETRKKGWKGTNLAQALNKSDGWHSKIMSRDIRLSVEALLEIAEALGIDPAILIKEGKEDRMNIIREGLKEIMREVVRENKT